MADLLPFLPQALSWPWTKSGRTFRIKIPSVVVAMPGLARLCCLLFPFAPRYNARRLEPCAAFWRGNSEEEKVAQTKSQSWAKRAERVFNDIERAEGERLFTEDAVTLVSATARKIVAHVMAEDADEVVIEETRGGVSAECACPVWEAGTPCRHMWAAILAADMDMASKSGAATVHQSSPTPVEAVPPAASSASAPVWRDLLFPTAIKASPAKPAGGPEYYVCYELRVRE